MRKKPGLPSLQLRSKLLLLFSCIFLLMFYTSASAQVKTPYVRIATIVVDSSLLEKYKAALKEHAETAVRVEPGVLSLYAVYAKEAPNHVTVFEIYASKEAYELPIP